MHFTTLAATLVAVAVGVVHGLPAAASSSAAVPTGSFYVKTAVKPSSADKSAFDGLYVYAYHTGAGLNDAMLSSNKSHAVAARALAGDIPNATDSAYFNVLFQLGSVPYAMLPNPADTIYADWQPVWINAGGTGPSNETAYYLGDDGALVWTNTAGRETGSSFNGWIDIDDTTQPGVQLFIRINGYAVTTPSSCADVDLVLEHLP